MLYDLENFGKLPTLTNNKLLTNVISYRCEDYLHQLCWVYMLRIFANYELMINKRLKIKTTLTF